MRDDSEFQLTVLCSYFVKLGWPCLGTRVTPFACLPEMNPLETAALTTSGPFKEAVPQRFCGFA